MADVDFSHAVLDVFQGSSRVNAVKPLPNDQYLRFTRTGTFGDINGNNVSFASVSIISNLPSKVSILYTGSFMRSGTEFLIGFYTFDYANWASWKVSNISFSEGDTYSFIIDIEVSGNTLT